MYRESWRLLINYLGEMFPNFKTLAEVEMEILFSGVAAITGSTCRIQLKQNSHRKLSEAKMQNLMTFASAGEATAGQFLVNVLFLL